MKDSKETNGKLPQPQKMTHWIQVSEFNTEPKYFW